MDITAPVRALDTDELLRLIERRSIDLFFGYDLPVKLDLYRQMRAAGVATIISYWGAPMSSLNSGIRLALKRLEVLLYPHKPDHFIFQSLAMQKTAVFGRGIHATRTSVVKTGVNTTLLSPHDPGATHVHRIFGIPFKRRIVVYAGHVHERKGIGVLLSAIKELAVARGRNDIHVLILGGLDERSMRFIQYSRENALDEHVTFAGYRKDISLLFSGCHLGVVPTTGWDSFPRSVLEMQGAGLPVIVSDCQGLPEMIENGATGLVVAAGDPVALADGIELLIDNDQVRIGFGAKARERIMSDFTEKRLIDDLVSIVRRVHFRN